MEQALTANDEAIEAWNGVLFDRFVEYRPVVTEGLGQHGEAALAAHPPQPGDRVLDIGCGFGDTAQRIAGLVGPEGEVVGIDAAERFVETARAEAAAASVGNVSFLAGDVEAMDLGDSFDYAFSRMGVMFFANPVAAIRNIRAALVPGGRLNAVVWRSKDSNDWVSRAEKVVEKYLDHPDETDEPTCGPGPFSMANADTTSDILGIAGFEQISLRRCDLAYRMGDDLDRAVDLVMALGPAGELIRVNEERGDELRPQLKAELSEVYSEFVTPDGVLVPSSTWIVSAVNPLV